MCRNISLQLTVLVIFCYKQTKDWSHYRKLLSCTSRTCLRDANLTNANTITACDWHLKGIGKVSNTALDNRRELEILTAIVHVIYPGFSRGSTFAKRRMNAAIYQGIAARKNPIINLQKQ